MSRKNMNKQELIEKIKIAFKDVKLEDGIGIFEADELDACRGDELIQAARKKDRTFWSNWQDIEDKHIAYYYSVMCFMDAKGLRFVIPAYMIYALNNYEDGSMSVDWTIYALERGGSGNDEKDLYTLEQKKVIAQFLKYMIEEVGDYWVDCDNAQIALDEKWGQYL